jgi:hypothetical protein
VVIADTFSVHTACLYAKNSLTNKYIVMMMIMMMMTMMMIIHTKHMMCSGSNNNVRIKIYAVV